MSHGPRLSGADGAELYGVVTGSGPVTVVLAHGWTLDSTCWEPVADRLTGARVLRYDHRGHGRSAAVDPATMTIDQLADDLAAVVAAEAPTGPLVLAGHSMGGMTTMALAERHPAVAARAVGVALVATAGGGLGGPTFGLPPRVVHAVRSRESRLYASHRWTGRDVLSTHPRLLEPAMRALLLGRHPSRSAVRTTTDVIAACRPTTVSGFLETLETHERHDSLAAYEGVPVHIMVGARDRLTPPRFSDRLRERLPQAELTLFPEAGHMLPVERPAGVARRIAALVEAAVPARR
ncbi:alpha/beta fold hydrolase [Pseudonocardia pini]|uniref:alpha/beta fold hydrolase n=1 Tax=Pseudonocardia pini TaxID=2758030 RepID=UPI0015EFFA98|nr:alpha/beta hydrolase [Pseudonocardia pini]